MTRARPDHEVADAAGESVRTANRLGFSALADEPADREPEPLYLAVNCPHCRQPALYPGQLPDGSSPTAECPGCDASFDYDIRDVYVTASRPG